ncbi:hypothetical protein MTO96_032500 [Rhipicephalus appendiculatus]
MQPVALTTPLTVPPLPAKTPMNLVDFIDDLSTFRTVSGLSELDVLQRVVPAALRGAAAQWLHFQPPFLSWDTFVAALQAEFSPVDYEYRVRCEFDARTQHPDEGLSAYNRAMQKLLCHADSRAPETVKVSAAMPP